MPVEIIGEFGTPGASSEWIEAEGKLAIKHVVKICGSPPQEMELEIVWQEHELGSYPVIALIWEDPTTRLTSVTGRNWLRTMIVIATTRTD